MGSLAPSPPVHAISFAASSPLHPRRAAAFCSIKRNWRRPRSFSGTLRCLVSIAAPTPTKPTPAEVSRTIMELSSVGTLSTLTHEGWPFGSGVRFAVDQLGTPILCLNSKNGELIVDAKSSLHVQFPQNGSRTPQCTLIGKLKKPDDRLLLMKLCEAWGKRFGEAVDDTLIHIVDVQQLHHIENFMEDGTWFSVAEYGNANPDPLRNCARMILSEMNDNHMDDIKRFCNIFVDIRHQVTDAKIVWVDRLGFDVHLRTQSDLYEARIPFPREVADERGVKSTFNCMSQLAWEVEKNYTTPEFEKVQTPTSQGPRRGSSHEQHLRTRLDACSKPLGSRGSRQQVDTKKS